MNYNIKTIKIVSAIFLISFMIIIFSNKTYEPESSIIITNEKVAEKLLQKNSVSCIIFTHENHILSRGKAAYTTWGKKCDKTVLACNCKNVMKIKKHKELNEPTPNELIHLEPVSDFNIIHLDIFDSYFRMGEKIIALFTKIYESNDLNYDWFIVADDDGYLFMDNLHKFIANRNPEEPMMYGSLLTIVVPNGYITGGPGIVITKESMLRLTKKMAAKECYADKFSDVTLGLCANKLGIGINEGKDENGLYRFHNVGPKVMYHGPLPQIIRLFSNHTGVIGKNCCSLESIGFHYVTPDEMYKIDSDKDYLRKLLI